MPKSIGAIRFFEENQRFCYDWASENEPISLVVLARSACAVPGLETLRFDAIQGALHSGGRSATVPP
jgi:hypothetical protein